ncbi:MAG TPA: LuxR C-terminal-related transcriptional regulator [Blastocatellia bacterium]|nr:LuxR C-terminal-related transcriptional regulator [Blastocatellia bacterium]
MTQQSTPKLAEGNNGQRLPRKMKAIEKLLTPREAEIARFVAEGMTNKQIARKASIAEGTVKIHLHRAYQKLGIANRAGLAVFMFGSDAGARDQRR